MIQDCTLNIFVKILLKLHTTDTTTTDQILELDLLVVAMAAQIWHYVGTSPLNLLNQSITLAIGVFVCL